MKYDVASTTITDHLQANTELLHTHRDGLLWSVVLDSDVLSQELLVITGVGTQVAVEHL